MVQRPRFSSVVRQVTAQAEAMAYATLLERDRIPVIMCTWRRIDRLPRTLELLAEQDTPAVLYVWNNSLREADRVDAVLAQSAVPAQSVHCKRNIGGFGRFYLARELADSHEALLFIDDDQDFGSTMISDQLASFEPDTLAGWWAWTFLPGAHSYGERTRVQTPLEPADYVGTCGMVSAAAIFRDPALFRCPRRYWFVEDVWLCYHARQALGWRLRRSFAEFVFVSDDKNIDRTLLATKPRMFRYLKRRGWDVAPEGSVRAPRTRRLRILRRHRPRNR